MSDEANPFIGKQFDIEHALSMYANGFAFLPAQEIYSDTSIKALGTVVDRCHIYLIGEVPTIDLNGASQIQRTLQIDFQALGQSYPVSMPIPSGLNLRIADNFWYFENETGKRFGPSGLQMLLALRDQTGLMNFKVRYVGQAFGKSGSRRAIDRLRKHETLQKISLLGTPPGYRLEIILIELQTNNRMITFINPFASDHTDTEGRIKRGTDKLFGTSEAERISLYEASLIRYFRPHFNLEFKDSFPSTKMRVLGDCYEKDFSALIAEICIDSLPYKLFSETVRPEIYHIITHNLHDRAERQAFFSTTA